MDSSRDSRSAGHSPDDGTADDTADDDPPIAVAAPGPRRSSYTAPPDGLRMPGTPDPAAAPAHVDDDELAAALAEQLSPYVRQVEPPLSPPPLLRPRTNRSAPVDDRDKLDAEREAALDSVDELSRSRRRHRRDVDEPATANPVEPGPTTPTAISIDTAAEPEPAHYRATSDLPEILHFRPRDRVPVLEESGLAPTPGDERVGTASRMFWLWFAANSSAVSVGLGATVFSLGLSLRQAMVAVLIGIAVSFLPLGLGTLAGKRSGQPTMVVSRSAFGVLGNSLPAAVALITRLFWGAVLLWLLSMSAARVLTSASLSAGLNERQVTVLSLALAGIIALVIAFFGYRLLAQFQLIVSIVSGGLVVGLIALTAGDLNMTAALSIADGPWARVATGAVLVFSFVGLLWANSSGDLARYQRPSGRSGASMLWATWGATLPPFVLLVWGAMLAASDPVLAVALVTDPLHALGGLLPGWYPIPLIAAVSLSLLSGVAVVLYSGAFALQSLGVGISRQSAVVVMAFALSLVAVALTLFAPGFEQVYRDLATTLAVPVAAWTGIVSAELMIRVRKLDADSLLRRGGVYADVRWVNLGAFVVFTVIGFGLTSASVSWLAWQGYLFPLLGPLGEGELAASDIGVVVALALGIATPLLVGVRAIRAQESSLTDRRARLRGLT